MPGRPASTLLALAAASAAGFGVTLVGAQPAVDVDRPRRRIVDYGDDFRPLPHRSNREIDRRVRHAARDRERQRLRFYGPGSTNVIGVLDNVTGESRDVIGLSRRGRLVLA